MKKNIKKRNWAFVLYPESAPENWRDLLQETGLLVAISPLHDKDLDPTGEPKKAHYHIILTFDGPTTYNNVKTITDRLNQPIPQPLEQIRGYYRYFTHMDNPEKYQYSDNEITTLNGFDINNYIELTYTEVSKYLLELQMFIRNNDIVEYSELLDILVDNELKEMWDVARNHTFLLDKYICSRRNKIKEEAQLKQHPIIDVSKLPIID